MAQRHGGGDRGTWGQDLQDAAVAGAVGTGAGFGGEALGGRIGAWAESSGAHGLPWGPGTTVADAVAGKGLLGGVTAGGVTSALGLGAADGVDIAEGSKHGSDILPDMLTSGLTGAAVGGANHAGHEFYEPGEGRHRAESPTFHPGKQIAVDGVIYGAGNAIESDLEK